MRTSVTVGFKKLTPAAIMPQYAHDGDAGFDLCALEDVEIWPGQTVLVRTGLAVELPEGFEMQIRPRSGLALKTPYLVKNSPGTIDQGYKGEVGIIIHNLFDPTSVKTMHIKAGDRIAQAVVKPVIRCHIVGVSALSESERGTGGFGSTGTR